MFPSVQPSSVNEAQTLQHPVVVDQCSDRLMDTMETEVAHKGATVLGGASMLIKSSSSILKVHASGKPLGPEFLILEKSSHIVLFPRFLYLVWVLRC